MNNEFPKMLYRAGGTEEIHGAQFTTRIVHDEAEQDEAIGNGWDLTTTEALAGTAAAVALENGGAPADDDKPATHAELKQKATELGLTFAHNTSKAALSEMIAAALPKD